MVFCPDKREVVRGRLLWENSVSCLAPQIKASIHVLLLENYKVTITLIVDALTLKSSAPFGYANLWVWRRSLLPQTLMQTRTELFLPSVDLDHICVNMGFPDSSLGKESVCNAEDLGSIPGSGRSREEGIGYPLQYSWASLVAQLVENPPTMWETWVRTLGWEDPLEKGKAIHSSILAWRIPWTV